MGKAAKNPGAFKSFQKSFYPSGTAKKIKQPKKKSVRLDSDCSMPEPTIKQGPSGMQRGIEPKVTTFRIDLAAIGFRIP